MNVSTKRRTFAGLAALAVGVVGIPMLPGPTAEATFPGENGLIAFTRDGDVWVMAADGTNQVNLTNDPDTNQYDPSWSPDGTQIAFYATPGDSPSARSDVWVMNADGSDSVNLTNDPDTDQYDPSWSPDGTQIAFDAFSNDTYDVWVMNADGSDSVNLTNDPDTFQYEPSWSPDGTQIAFDAFSGNDNYDVWVMNADGSDQVNLTKDPDTFQGDPSWSPDGTQIAFADAGPPGETTEIYVMRADGAVGHVTGAAGTQPDWQPLPASPVTPVAEDDDYDDVPRDTAFTSPGSVLANDTGDDLTAVLETDASLGELDLADDGTFTYTLDDPATSEASDTFTYQACAADEACSDPATVTLAFEDPSDAVATTVTLTAEPDEPVEGDDVTLTATVEADGEADAEPTGTVEFFDGDDSLGTAELPSPATLTVSDLAAGEHDIIAGYSGDDTFAGAVSDPLAVTVAETEPTDPPGEDGRIAFSRDGDVWTMKPDGTDAMNLTNDPDSIQVSPSWSPDGTQIAFNAFSGDDSDLWTMNADGTDPVNLTDDPDADQVRPSWSPDGTQIAFDAFSGDGFDVWTMNADGTDPENLTDDPDADQVAPAWSPDGTQIAFDAFSGDDIDLWVMNADGTDPENLTNDPDAPQGDAAWSPDGTQIAFAKVEFPGDVWVMNADGTDPENLTNDPDADQVSPSWSPDGTQIAIAAAATDGAFEIHVMDADGANPQAIGAGTEPDWQPQHTPELVASTVTLTSDPDKPVEGDDVTLTATVEADSDTEPTGTVEFFDGDDSLGTAELGSPANFTVSDLGAGEHAITAHYSGDDTFAAAVSDPLTITVAEQEPTDSSGFLPDTGLDVAGLTGLAAAMLAAGGLGLFLARRRRAKINAR